MFSLSRTVVSLGTLWTLSLDVKDVRATTIEPTTTDVLICYPYRRPFTWKGGTPPYYVYYNASATVISQVAADGGNNITIATGLGFGNIYDHSYWTPLYFQDTFHTGTFQITDAKNVTSPVAYYRLQDIRPSCVGKPCAADFIQDCGVPFVNGPDVSNGSSDLGVQPPSGDVHPCNLTTIKWEGGTPPFTLAIRTTGLAILQEQVFEGVTSTSVTIQIPFPKGVQVNYAVKDAAGRVDTVGPFTLGDPETNCVINNITQRDVSVPSPTTSLPFPTNPFVNKGISHLSVAGTSLALLSGTVLLTTVATVF